MNEEQKYSADHAEEISLIEIFRFLWIKKLFVAKVTLVFILLGVIYTLTSPEEYTAELVLMPDSGGSSGPSSSLSAIAGLAGFNVSMAGGGSSTAGISPGMYSKVIQSTPFLMPLMDKSFHFKKYGDITLEEYFTNYEEKGLNPFGFLSSIPKLPYTIIGWFTPDKEKAASDSLSTVVAEEEESVILNLSKKEISVASAIASRILILSEEGVVTVSVTMQDPVVAAELTEYTTNALTEYVTKHRISKEKRNLDFVEQQANEAERKFHEAQQQLASFRDSNKNVVTETARTEEERLNSEYNLRFGIYRTLVEQREKAKIKLQEVTPLFDVLEPIQIPHGPSSPVPETVFFITVFLGVFLGYSFVIGMKIYNDFLKPAFFPAE